MLFSIQEQAVDLVSFKRLMAELENASDRSVAIVAAACVEDQLTEAFKALLEKDDAVFQQLFRAGGALGSFSTKIGLGYLQGFYDLSMRKELETIKTIRNVFAHEQRAQDFGVERCRDLANNLCVSEKLEFYRPWPISHSSTNDIKAGDEVWLGIGIREAFGSRNDGPTSILPELKPDQKLSPREKYLRSCQFYVTYLFAMIFKNLGDQHENYSIFPKNAFRLAE
jgi:hypothetical protein